MHLRIDTEELNRRGIIVEQLEVVDGVVEFRAHLETAKKGFRVHSSDAMGYLLQQNLSEEEIETILMKVNEVFEDETIKSIILR